MDEISSLPICVQFLGLDREFWGLDSLSKIGSMLGVPLKTDKFTKDRTMLRYAGLLIDIELNEDFSEYIEFASEYNVLIRHPVIYEWKPFQ